MAALCFIILWKTNYPALRSSYSLLLVAICSSFHLKNSPKRKLYTSGRNFIRRAWVELFRFSSEFISCQLLSIILKIPEISRAIHRTTRLCIMASEAKKRKRWDDLNSRPAPIEKKSFSCFVFVFLSFSQEKFAFARCWSFFFTLFCSLQSILYRNRKSQLFFY